VARRRRAKSTGESPTNEEFVAALARDPLFIAAQAALALKVVLVVLVFAPNIVDAFALVKSAAAHATSGVLAALLVALVVVHGRRILIWNPAHVAIGGLLLAFAAASVVALDPTTAAFGVWRRYLGLDQMLDNALLYIAAVLLVPSPRDVGRLATITLATAGVVVAYVYVQKLGLDPVKYKEGAGVAPPGTFGQPDVAGAYLGMASATALGVALWVQRWSTRAAVLVFSVACLAAALFTNIRGGLIGLGFGWLAVVALVALRPAARRKETLAILGGAAAVGLVGTAASPVGARFLDLANLLADRSAQSRLEVWSTALRALAQRPLLGLGPDNFGIAYPALREERSAFLSNGELQNSTHNWLLHVATSSGLLGSVCFLALLVIAVVLAARLAREGDAAAVALVPLAAFFGQGLVSINDLGTDWIPWLCLGLIAGASGTRLVGGQRAAYPRWVATVGIGAALIAAAAGVVAANQRVVASGNLAQSDSLVAANRGFEALPHAIAAVAADPRRAEYWGNLGVAYNATGNTLPASAAFSEAARLKPTDPVFWANLALMRLFLQDTRGASLALTRATAADPYDAQSRDLSARVALLLNDDERASREGHLAVRLQPAEPSVYEAPTLADIKLGRLKEAEHMLRSGLVVVPPQSSLQVHLLLAQVLHAQRRDAEARAEIAVALTIDPNDKRAQQLQQDYK
jgi:O-antigen ligase/Flp pilus assembly protein TadD